MDELQCLRKQIDKVDRQIIKLLAKRFSIVRRIGKYKKERDISPLDEKRWNEVLQKKMEQAKSLGLDVGVVKSIYELIHEFALRAEKDL